MFPLLHGLYWLVSNLSEHGPALIAVDDAHWADTPSLRFLLYLAQRLTELPVAVVLARRPAAPASDEGGLLAKLAGHPAAEEVGLTPLSEQAVDRLVRASFADDVVKEFSSACAEVTRGNPLLLHQLLTSLETEGLSSDEAGARRVRGLGPEAVSRSVLHHPPRPGPGKSTPPATLTASAAARAVFPHFGGEARKTSDRSTIRPPTRHGGPFSSVAARKSVNGVNPNENLLAAVARTWA